MKSLWTASEAKIHVRLYSKWRRPQKRVYDRVQAEWRYASNTDNSKNAELARLPEEEETVNHRVERMFVSHVNDMSKALTDMVHPLTQQ